MKILVTDKKGYQKGLSIPYNFDIELKVGAIISHYPSETFKLTKFVEIKDHYIIFEGRKIPQRK